MSTSTQVVSIMAHLPATVPSLQALHQHVGAIYPFAKADLSEQISDGFNGAQDALSAYANIDEFGNPPKNEMDAVVFKVKVLNAVRLPLSATVFRRASDLSLKDEKLAEDLVLKLERFPKSGLAKEAAEAMRESAAILWLDNYMPAGNQLWSILWEHRESDPSFILNNLGIPFETSDLEDIADVQGLVERFPQMRAEIERRCMRIISNHPGEYERFSIDEGVLKTAAREGLISDAALEGMLNSMRTYTNAERRDKRLKQIGDRILSSNTAAFYPAAFALAMTGIALLLGFHDDILNISYRSAIPKESFRLMEISRDTMKIMAKGGLFGAGVLSLIILGRSIWNSHVLKKAERDHPDVKK